MPCKVSITTSGTYEATIAAEGSVNVTASRTTIGQTQTPNQPAIISAATGDAISLTGTDLTAKGQLVAAHGSINLTGSRATAQCGVLAASVRITGSDTAAPIYPQCSE